MDDDPEPSDIQEPTDDGPFLWLAGKTGQIAWSVLVQDVVAFGLLFMSWGAVFGVGGSPIGMGLFGAHVGGGFWYLFRRRHFFWGQPVSSTIAGAVTCFAVIGVIVWIVKSLI